MWAGDPGWDQIISLGADTCPYVLVNPNSGPGPSQWDGTVQAFARTAGRCQSAGMRALGYVDSNYARVPLSKVLQEIDQYRAWLKTDGIFIDQGA